MIFFQQEFKKSNINEHIICLLLVMVNTLLCPMCTLLFILIWFSANALLVNDDCQTALDLARAKGYSKIVRLIEVMLSLFLTPNLSLKWWELPYIDIIFLFWYLKSHICLYAGWLRELYGPGFLEMLAPQLISRKVWV